MIESISPLWLAPPQTLWPEAALGALAPECQSIGWQPREVPSDCVFVAAAESAFLPRARQLAERYARPLYALNQGLFESPRFGGRFSPLVSLTCNRIDHGGITNFGWAETVLSQPDWDDPVLLERARAGIRALTQARLGGPLEPRSSSIDFERRPILVLADMKSEPGSVDIILKTALSRHEAADLLLCVASPNSAPELIRHARQIGVGVTALDRDIWPLLDTARQVYSAGCWAGFVALLGGKRVYCTAPCFYAGWGVTDDSDDIPRRETPRNVVELFAASVIIATRYADPFRHLPCQFEDVLEILSDWKRVLAANDTIGCCYGISFWKRSRTADFFAAANRLPTVPRSSKGALSTAKRTGKAIAYWPQRKTQADFSAASFAANVTMLRIEDGFIRSVGLGTNLNLPASIVADSRGIYYDPTVPSDLEWILSETDFNENLVARAGRLRALMITKGITKYNLAEAPIDIVAPAGARRIVVPGQFELDKSVLLGGAGITTNAELLRRVRAGNPDAFIVYKPHPDVEAGHRPGYMTDAQLAGLCDAVVRSASILSLIEWADSLHTLTSLSGFEALLRGRQVVTYGQPFYASWGLTQDQAPVGRRQRRLTIDQLVAGTLILYARYIDPVTLLPCGPELLIERIATPELWRPTRLSSLRQWQGGVFRQIISLSHQLAWRRRRTRFIP